MPALFAIFEAVDATQLLVSCVISAAIIKPSFGLNCLVNTFEVKPVINAQIISDTGFYEVQ